jgi:hypothetical protein
MNARILASIVFVASGIVPLAGCESASPSATPPSAVTPARMTTAAAPSTATPAASPTSVPAPSATPTPTVLAAVAGPTLTPTVPEPVGGELEVRIPFSIYSGQEGPPADVPDCVNTIPFLLTGDGARTMIEGEGRIDCHFVNTPSGQPVTFDVILGFDAILNGELLPATPNQPAGWLDAYLALDGAIEQMYSNYPLQAQNPCPEESPCRTPTSDVIPLPLAYEEGSTVTTPWTFVLHLE